MAKGAKEDEEGEKKEEGLCGTRSCVTSVTSLPAREVLAVVIQFLPRKEPLFLERVTAPLLRT